VVGNNAIAPRLIALTSGAKKLHTRFRSGEFMHSREWQDYLLIATRGRMPLDNQRPAMWEAVAVLECGME
jgi:hypothetical protein